MLNVETMSSSQQYIQLYEEQRALLEQNSCPTMNAQRSVAAQLLAQKKLPTRRNERYRYFNVQEAFAPDYGVNLLRTLPAIDPYTTYRCNVPNLSTQLYFVVNDTPMLHCAPNQPTEGVTICAMREGGALLQEYYNKAVNDADTVAALNTMLAQDGIVVHVAAHTKVKHPIQLVNVCDAAMAMMSNRRLLIVVEEGAEVQFLLCDHVAGKSAYLTTQVTEAFIGKQAKVDFYTIEENADNVNKLALYYVQQQAESRVAMNGVTLHAGHSHNHVNVQLLGQHADHFTAAAVIAGDRELVDYNIVVEHVAENCNSEMLYKYVLDDESEGAFAGKVLVREGAQHTTSQQTNANLCVTPTARAYAQPMLEIYADDVKCNHGSTVGKLDETALFYMRQRGIPEAEARLLLQHAFVNEVLQRVELEHLRDRLAHLVELRFRGELSKCAGCKMCQ